MRLAARAPVRFNEGMDRFLAGESLDIALLWSFAIALFIGALIGLERERKLERSPHQFGGLRTYILIAEAGAIAGWLSLVLDTMLIFVGGILGVSAFIGVAYYLQSRHSDTMPGLTSEFAGLVTYLLGGAAVMGMQEIAVVLGIATSAILAFKENLHDLVHGMSREDVSAILKLCFATFIVLPLLPNRPVDPLGVLNPYMLWLLVILISGLSLVGYIAVRVLGENRGMALTGLFGGLVSSTAVTLTFARRSLDPRARPDALALGVLLAWSVMFVRVVVEVAVVHAPLLTTVAPLMAVMFVVTLIGAATFWLRGRREPASSAPVPEDVPLKNPFNLTSAIQFGVFFAGVLLLVELARSYVDEEWLYAVAAPAGSTDVDAITLSMADQSRRGLDPAVATGAILMATVFNTLVKTGMVFVLGGRVLARRLGIVAALVCASGLLTWFLHSAA